MKVVIFTSWKSCAAMHCAAIPKNRSLGPVKGSDPHFLQEV